MKKLLLLLTLFISFNCIGQDTTSIKGFTMKDQRDSIYSYLKKDGVGVIHNTYFTCTSAKSILIPEYKPSFHIDSTYLQLIIQELERHGYTLLKLSKKSQSWKSKKKNQ